MATKRKGRLVRLNYDSNNVGGSGASWQLIPLARERSMDKSSGTTDGSTVEDDGWAADIVTTRSWNLTGTACLDPASTVHAALETALDNGALVWVQLDQSAIGGTKKEGQAYVTKWSTKFPKDDDLVTVDFEFKMQGPPVASHH
jgi:hypothetical protein